MVKNELEIARIENEKKRLAGIREENLELSRKFNKGTTERSIICDIIYNKPKNGEKTIIRTDTGETVQVLRMTAQELQEDMEFGEDANVLSAQRLITSGTPEKKKRGRKKKVADN